MENARQGMEKEMERRISVIIPTFNRQTELTQCLTSIRSSDCVGLSEIIIVDDASRQPVRIEVDFPGSVQIKLIRNSERQGAARSRNLGAQVASGEVIAFLDDDTQVTPNWFSVAQRELTVERAALTGPVKGFDKSIIARARQQRYEERYDGLTDGKSVNFMAGGNSIIWRSVFIELGGFPPTKALSDGALVARLRQRGLHCHFVWHLKISHRNSKGLIMAISQAWNAGVTHQSFAAVPIRAEMNKALYRLALEEPDLLVNLVNSFLHFCFIAGSVWALLLIRRRVDEYDEELK